MGEMGTPCEVYVVTISGAKSCCLGFKIADFVSRGSAPREKKSAILGPKTATFSSRNGYHTHLTCHMWCAHEIGRLQRLCQA